MSVLRKCCAILFTAICLADDVPENAHPVVEIGSGNYSLLADGQAWILMAYAPWCGACKGFGPTFDKMSDKIGKARIAKMNVVTEKALATTFFVTRLPTLFLVRNTTVWEYPGPRTSAKISTFAHVDYKGASSLWVSPLGIVGGCLFGMMSFAVRLEALYWYCNEDLGVNHGLLWVVIVGLVVILPMSIGTILSEGVDWYQRMGRRRASRARSQASETATEHKKNQ